MRYLILFMLIGGLAYAQSTAMPIIQQQPITVLDNSDYTIPDVKTIDTDKDAEEINAEQSGIANLQKLIIAKQNHIAELQNEIDTGAQAGVQGAVQYASPSVQAALKTNTATGTALGAGT